MSTWSHPIEGFGGANVGSAYSYFRNLRRVLCGAPVPAGYVDAPLPTWLGGSAVGGGGSTGGLPSLPLEQGPPAVAAADKDTTTTDGPSFVLNNPILLDDVSVVAADPVLLREIVGRIALQIVAAVMRAMQQL